MRKLFSVTLSAAKGLGLGRTHTPDASPLRLAQHDISPLVDEHVLKYKKHAHGVNCVVTPRLISIKLITVKLITVKLIIALLTR